MGIRQVVQFDGYLYSKAIWEHIEGFLQDSLIQEHTNIVPGKNIIVYRKGDAQIQNAIEKGEDMGEWLDHGFYSYCQYNRDKTKRDISRVSINVIKPVKTEDLATYSNYIGQLLVMECNEEEISQYISQIFSRYQDYKGYIWAIDQDLQLTFEIYNKYGVWENNPFYKTHTLTEVD